MFIRVFFILSFLLCSELGITVEAGQIKLQTVADGQIINAPDGCVMHFKTLKNLLDDTVGDGEPIPIANGRAEDVQCLLTLVDINHSSSESSESSESSFIQALKAKALGLDQVIRLVNLADFLDLQPLNGIDRMQLLGFYLTSLYATPMNQEALAASLSKIQNTVLNKMLVDWLAQEHKERILALEGGHFINAARHRIAADALATDQRAHDGSISIYFQGQWFLVDRLQRDPELVRDLLFLNGHEELLNEELARFRLFVRKKATITDLEKAKPAFWDWVQARVSKNFFTEEELYLLYLVSLHDEDCDEALKLSLQESVEEICCPTPGPYYEFFDGYNSEKMALALKRMSARTKEAGSELQSAGVKLFLKAVKSKSDDAITKLSSNEDSRWRARRTGLVSLTDQALFYPAAVLICDLEFRRLVNMWSWKINPEKLRTFVRDDEKLKQFQAFCLVCGFDYTLQEIKNRLSCMRLIVIPTNEFRELAQKFLIDKKRIKENETDISPHLQYLKNSLSALKERCKSMSLKLPVQEEITEEKIYFQIEPYQFKSSSDWRVLESAPPSKDGTSMSQ